MGKTRLKIIRLWIEKWKLIMLVIAILGCNHFPKAFVFIELIVLTVSNYLVLNDSCLSRYWLTRSFALLSTFVPKTYT